MSTHKRGPTSNELDSFSRVACEIAPLSAAMDPVAQELGLSTRTLRRRLAEEGITFEAIRDDLRRTAASELLELTDLSMTEIAQAVAFASPQVFAESFARWMGTTPSAWRSRLRDEEFGEKVVPV